MKSFRFPVRGTGLILTMIAAMILSACTGNTSSTDEHGLLPHLTVDMLLPKELSPDSTATFHVEVRQGEKPVEAANITFEFWPEGHPEQLVEIIGVSGGRGLYSAEYRLNSEGVYVVRCRVSSGSLEAMPAKRFAIGEEAVLRLATLEQQQDANAAADGGSKGGHHHH